MVAAVVDDVGDGLEQTYPLATEEALEQVGVDLGL